MRPQHRECSPEREIHSITGVLNKQTNKQNKTKTQEKAQINNLTSHLNELAKEQQTNSKYIEERK